MHVGLWRCAHCYRASSRLHEQIIQPGTCLAARWPAIGVELGFTTPTMFLAHQAGPPVPPVPPVPPEADPPVPPVPPPPAPPCPSSPGAEPSAPLQINPHLSAFNNPPGLADAEAGLVGRAESPKSRSPSIHHHGSIWPAGLSGAESPNTDSTEANCTSALTGSGPDVPGGAISNAPTPSIAAAPSPVLTRRRATTAPAVDRAREFPNKGIADTIPATCSVFQHAT